MTSSFGRAYTAVTQNVILPYRGFAIRQTERDRKALREERTRASPFGV